MEVCGEADGHERFLAEIKRAAPDVVVMELYLQDRETISLIKQLHAGVRAVQIVVLSRHDELVYAVPAFKAGARAFVMKHDDPRAVTAAIREVHMGKPCFSWEVNSLLLSRMSGARTQARDVGTVALSPRELEVVTLIASGHSSREIANRLGVSIKTVEAHRAHIKQKANVDNSAALIRFSMSVANDRSLAAAG
jgi:DNA-binding NarL/FixJ family response regulator